MTATEIRKMWFENNRELKTTVRPIRDAFAKVVRHLRKAARE